MSLSVCIPLSSEFQNLIVVIVQIILVKSSGGSNLESFRHLSSFQSQSGHQDEHIFVIMVNEIVAFQ
jgi:hypothetical protein